MCRSSSEHIGTRLRLKEAFRRGFGLFNNLTHQRLGWLWSVMLNMSGRCPTNVHHLTRGLWGLSWFLDGNRFVCCMVSRNSWLFDMMLDAHGYAVLARRSVL